MDPKLFQIVDNLLNHGSLSPSTILGIGTDFGFKKKTIQFTVQIALDNGSWHLDKELKIARGSFYKDK